MGFRICSEKIVGNNKRERVTIDENAKLNVFFSKRSGMPIVFCEDYELDHLKTLLMDAINFYDLKKMSYREAIQIQQDLIQKD